MGRKVYPRVCFTVTSTCWQTFKEAKRLAKLLVPTEFPDGIPFKPTKRQILDSKAGKWKDNQHVPYSPQSGQVALRAEDKREGGGTYEVPTKQDL